MNNTATKNHKGRTWLLRLSIMTSMVSMMVGTAMADGSFGQSVTVNTSSDVDADGLMGKIIGLLLSITRYVGIALVIYGVYEIVMSFMQNQPEAKTKGIIMALAGAIMIALKSVLIALKIITA